MNDSSLRLPAPAKLNLMLRIVGRRPDGYHLLQTVFQFIDLCDWITLTPRQDGVIRRVNPLPGVPEDSDLAVRAARALRDACGNPLLGVDIDLEKNLPMGGGVGGGSSDAATVLLGLNQLWRLHFGLDEIAALGLNLGADVPVFVRGFSAWGEGVGEHLTALPDLPEPWYVVLAPHCQVATGAIFGAPGLTRDNKPITMVEFLRGNEENHCLPVVTERYPLVKEALFNLELVCGGSRLTGTGACVFAVLEYEHDARHAAEQLAAGEWQVFVAKGSNISPLHNRLGIEPG
ncbi:4-(cytidine 5'-diphospho)-2-C-methyl-D-erythritol kinase [Candidatus Methylospira mobilis]|uniref:4-diphosphocytidyl-2-C-methyl-D-erythritol kinase n=1 Tax=Candidatus Methylospira mobilis TaxID=1808979 RepID=A0A5Q0BIQ3_9GAMM|nr:4-(cytidine 5'-diphospho)-2-C-methyl-D-erythritol kinase [Candidatus Methylospira mobilis]QFY43755.1 4-(cytidine 5'-diphospho)-2-C-methyl-D-erythritol kinase [Candidatus Methylospira mobilis]WNV04744.1 4-(cytidine 5'-diphospho)-2-C-methyl-D-erythritol kinase [Candidatus Methylospira mobilis]